MRPARSALEVAGQTVELTPRGCAGRAQGQAGLGGRPGPQVVVVLSTELTDALKAEGLARDFVHLIQTARKDEELDYQARIRLRINATGALAEAIKANADYICRETLATELKLDASLADAQHTGEIEGNVVGFAIEVVV